MNTGKITFQRNQRLDYVMIRSSEIWQLSIDRFAP